MNESTPQGEPCNSCGGTCPRHFCDTYGDKYGGPYKAVPAAPLAAPLVAVPPYADSEGYSLAMRVMQSDLYPKLDAVERAECDELIRRGQSVQGQSAALPALWQWRRKDQPWSLETTFEHEVFATTADSEVRQLYASLPLPAPAGVEGGEKQDCGHPAAPSGEVTTSAPRSQPCALDRPELPVRLSDEAKDAARYRWLRDKVLIDGEINTELWVGVDSAEWPNKWALVGGDLDKAVDAALSAQGNGGTA